MLIVDDSACSRAIIRHAVSKLDVKIVGEANNGKKGVELYLKLVPDIVTMDLAMHDGCGIEALKEIMSINNNASVIVISSIGRQEKVAAEATALGAKKVLDKSSIGDSLTAYLKEAWSL